MAKTELRNLKKAGGSKHTNLERRQTGCCDYEFLDLYLTPLI